MDNTVAALVDFALGDQCIESYQVLSDHFIDSLGCALGSVKAMPVKTVSELYSLTDRAGSDGVKLLTKELYAVPEQAAFCNTAAIRYLDFNDTGVGGHPSDCLGAIVVAAQLGQKNLRDVLWAMNIVYEVYSALRIGGLYGNLLRQKHIDQIQVVIAATLASGFLMGLSHEQLSHALGLALAPCVPMRATRTGNISHWKAMATSHSSMSSIHACRLAKKGITGPEKPFEGSGGLYQMLDIQPLDLSQIGRYKCNMSAVESTAIKVFPANYNVQGPARTLIEMRAEFDIEDIVSVDIGLHWGGWHSQGGGAGDVEAKWNPTGRESAENSLPFVAAVSLFDGFLDYDSFSEDSILRPRIKSLMKKIRVHADKECTERHAGVISSWPSKIKVTLSNGVEVSREVRSPLGHPFNPIKAIDIKNKFIKLTEKNYNLTSMKAILRQLDGVDDAYLATNIDELLSDIHGAFYG